VQAGQEGRHSVLCLPEFVDAQHAQPTGRECGGFQCVGVANQRVFAQHMAAAKQGHRALNAVWPPALADHRAQLDDLDVVGHRTFDQELVVVFEADLAQQRDDAGQVGLGQGADEADFSGRTDRAWTVRSACMVCDGGCKGSGKGVGHMRQGGGWVAAAVQRQR